MLDNMQWKRLETGPSDHTYQYVFTAPTVKNYPTIAFFHGFPSTAFDWRHQLKYFSTRGFGVFAADMLGYGGTSKPDSVAEYGFLAMVKSIINILDHEGVQKFHGVAHDFGSHFMSRLVAYHPNRLLSLTFISVPYTPPGLAFDLDAVNAMTKSRIGMEKFGYMKFLASKESPVLMETHVSFPIDAKRGTEPLKLQSFHSLVYAADAEMKADNFYPPGRLEYWLNSDRREQRLVVSPNEEQFWLDSFRRGGLEGPTNWYRALLEQVNILDEKAALEEGLISTKIETPVLAIDSQADKASVHGFMDLSIKSHVAQLQMEYVSSQGHWPHLVSHEEVNNLIHNHVDSIAR